VKTLVLAGKDLRIYFRDRAAVLLGFGLPIVLCTVFGAAMGAIGGSGRGVGRIELVVEDADASAESRGLIDELRASDGLRIDLLDAGDGDDTARARVAEGDAPAGLRIGPGYGAAVVSGGELPLVLYRDPGKTIEQQILAGSLIPAFLGVLGENAGKRMSGRILETLEFPEVGRARAQAILDASWTSMDALVSELEASGAVADDAPSAAGTEEAEDPDDDGFDFATGIADVLGLEIEDVVGGGAAAQAQKRAQQANAVAGMAVMMLLFGLIACGGTLLEEERAGTLARLRLAPGGSGAILGGKCVFTFVVGLAQLAVLFLFGNLVFDVPLLRAPLALAVLSIAVAVAVTGFGILFAVVCRSQKQLEGLATIVVLTMSALGGSWWPRAITPEWFQKLGLLTLNAWAMDGYQDIFWRELGLAAVLPEVGVLLAIGAVAAVLAWRLFERRMRV
jgi:ABC-2 type transport system permease protein